MRKKKRQRSQRTSNYRSGFEATLANQLKRGGVSFQYESIKLEYTKTATYTPDFILPNGIIIEAKGVWTVEDRKKLFTSPRATSTPRHKTSIYECFQQDS